LLTGLQRLRKRLISYEHRREMLSSLRIDIPKVLGLTFYQECTALLSIPFQSLAQRN
jgi:hypothetical protein